MKGKALGLVVPLAFVGSVLADTVGWRHDGTGKFMDATPPTSWSREKNVVWKTAMPGPSNASPVLSGGRIFVCSEPDILLCLDQQSGKILWQKINAATDLLPENEPYQMPRTHDTNGHSSPTPVTDGAHVYALFGTGVAVCYDVEGNAAWRKYIESPTSQNGHSASPVLADKKLIVHILNLVA